ncbi:hypothetical protein K2173_003044 [Erythroxylum novogranatense]|uniref:Aluminum-activated malate transporter n=1 Tax=Erythroxylum novogranatense TaxID=1862640 RepID=A0AAV8S896_9ROSI|nr:hypothetical protein K2173_003044 [Erythroxylum novogranatense]
MASTVITITDVVGATRKEENGKFRFSPVSVVSLLKEKTRKHDMKKLIHSIKVGVALVIVSLLYLLDPLYGQVGDNNAMWAIMTVVVIFEFYAGATLSKGLNRGIGTVLGGGLGYLIAIFSQEFGGVGNSIIVGICVFIFGGAATYTRLIPSIKRTYDYGAMIFILTFSLVAVSGFREDQNVMDITRERLVMIVLGFVICICTSLFVFPIWASDELHGSMVAKFEKLASSFEGCLEEHFRLDGKDNEEIQPISPFRICIEVLHSKSKDESLINFARWEPWHGKFGLSYPWKQYQKIGDVLRELTVLILSLKVGLKSSAQDSMALRHPYKQPCEAIGSSLAWTIRELGDSIKEMRRCQSEAFIVPKLKSARQELSRVVSISKLEKVEDADILKIASSVAALIEIVEKLEELVKEVEELGELASFCRN